MKRGLAVLAAVAVGIAVPGFGGGATAKPRAAAAVPQSPGMKLAKRAFGKSLPKSVKATRKVLALSGVATVREGQVIVPAVEPVSRWKLTARETVLLAKGVKNRRLTVGRLAQALAESGVEIDGRSPVQAFPEMVSDWLSFSSYDSKNGLSVPGEFVLNSYYRSRKGEIFDPLGDPSKIRLSTLDAILVLANLERVIEPGAPPAPPAEEDESMWDEEDYEEEPVARTAQTSGGPCASVAAGLDALGPVASGAANIAIGKATGSAIEAYANSLRDGAGDAVGELLTALDVLDRILRTAAFAESLEVTVFPGLQGELTKKEEATETVHKPTDGDNRVLHFAGIVGLKETARKLLQKQLDTAKDHAFRDSLLECAKLHGVTLPKLPFGELAGEMEEWSAYWTLDSSPDDVRWHHPRRTKLKRIDFASAASKFKVSVRPENRKWHKHEDGREVATQAVAKLEIAGQKPPSAGAILDLTKALVTANAGDAIGPSAEMLEGLFRTIAKPTGSGVLRVEYHVQDPCAEFWENRGKGRAAC